MENYNYLEQVTADAKEAILENMEYWSFDDRDELEEVLKEFCLANGGHGF